MTWFRFTGDWAKASKAFGNLAGKFQKASEKAVLQEAHFIRAQIVKNMQTSGAHAGAPFAKHSPLTYVIRSFTGSKGGSKPLMTTIGLQNIIVKKQGRSIFVGALGSSQWWRDPATHEKGRVQQTTIRQQNFLAAALRAAGMRGAKIYVLRYPARPFITPVLAKFAQPADVYKRISETIAREMGFSTR